MPTFTWNGYNDLTGAQSLTALLPGTYNAATYPVTHSDGFNTPAANVFLDTIENYGGLVNVTAWTFSYEARFTGSVGLPAPPEWVMSGSRYEVQYFDGTSWQVLQSGSFSVGSFPSYATGTISATCNVNTSELRVVMAVGKPYSVGYDLGITAFSSTYTMISPIIAQSSFDIAMNVFPFADTFLQPVNSTFDIAMAVLPLIQCYVPWSECCTPQNTPWVEGCCC